MIFTASIIIYIFSFFQTGGHKEIIGVYQGESLFIQNPYNPTSKEFCITSIYINDRLQKINYNFSAIKLDFENQDLYTPVTIKIQSRDSTCTPIIINPNAILFHTSYKFIDVDMTDSLLSWITEGEREHGVYSVEKLDGGLWSSVYETEAKGQFERSEYSYVPLLDEGTNKFRIKYDFGNGRYLYSNDVDYDFYPEPVTFSPKSSRSSIKFSRVAEYEIYDPAGELILQGTDDHVDISFLLPAEYVIYFDGKDPGVFTRLEN